MLGCENTNQKMSHFKARVIEKAVEEINKNTDYLIDIEYIKTGRKITHIKFCVYWNWENYPNPKIHQNERADFVMKLDSNAHSVFLLHYHLVLVVKYRRKVFDNEISYRAKEIFEYIAPNYNITLQEWNHDSDHVHILFKAHPKSEISKFINAYKSASSRLLKKEFPEIRKKLWKEYFWSQSFCLITTGGAPIEVIRKYIQSQGEKL